MLIRSKRKDAENGRGARRGGVWADDLSLTKKPQYTDEQRGRAGISNEKFFLNKLSNVWNFSRNLISSPLVSCREGITSAHLEISRPFPLPPLFETKARVKRGHKLKLLKECVRRAEHRRYPSNPSDDASDSTGAAAVKCDTQLQVRQICMCKISLLYKF